MELSPEILKRIELLQKKYNASGQDMVSYLDGLLHADFLTYWDYIHLDTLLSLQSPRTPFPDEKIFIIYHQITELYLNLILHECEQISSDTSLTSNIFIIRLKRINSYFKNLINSFDVMVDGMDKEQFLNFRMSLLPASGFQSGQYRMVEISATDFIQLLAEDKREEVKNKSLEEQYEFIYWKNGATELSSGNKTLTLKQFEKKYNRLFIELAQNRKQTNFWQLYRLINSQKISGDESITQLRMELKRLDVNVNINWKLAHYKSAVRYLHRNPEDIAATGGTNWQKYLPPRFQRCIFYPELWTIQEQEEWGKTWVEEQVFAK